MVFSYSYVRQKNDDDKKHARQSLAVLITMPMRQCDAVCIAQ
jgi:hypothetical protein